VARYQQGLFLEPSWLAVYLGQGLIPAQPDGSASQLDDAELAARLEALDSEIGSAVSQMPYHGNKLDALVQAGRAAR
jgi:tryptophan halogenase